MEANSILEGIRGIESYARGLHSNEAIGGWKSLLGKAYSVLDKPIEKFGGVESGHIANNLASDAPNYTWGSAARFGMQTYMLGSAAGRIASGGGLYKDANGNFNIIGIPLI